MNEFFNDYLISDDSRLLQFNRIYELLADTYWAYNRSQKIIKKSIENSICIGAYYNGTQIGFARITTDNATVYLLSDLIIDEKFRGQGLGKMIVKLITEDGRFNTLYGILGTRDAHGLYEKYGFERNPEAMRRLPTF